MSCGDNLPLEMATLGGNDFTDTIGLTGGGGGVSTPQPGKVGKEYLGMLTAYQRGLPEQLQLEETYKPQFTALELKNIYAALVGGNGAPGYLDIYKNNVVPAITEAETSANNIRRTANISDLNTLGPDALAAMRNANPAQARLMDSLTKTATEQMDLGDTVDPVTANRISKGVRANWAGRGLGESMPSQLDEALKLYGGGQDLLSQRESEASAVSNLNAQLYTDPLLEFTGVGSSAPTAGQNLTSTGANVGQNANATILPQDELSNLFSTVYNANANANVASANNATALCGAGIGAAGSIAGGAMGAFCWAAREIFGVNDLRWMEFRNWMLNKAPEKFRRFYMAHGEEWAKRLAKANRGTRAAVRAWMERRLAPVPQR